MRFAKIKIAQIKDSMNNKKLQVWLPLLFSMVIIIGIWIGYTIKSRMPNTGIFFTEKRRPVQEVIDLIENKYVDEKNYDSLNEAAINAILNQLDPHSILLAGADLQQAKEDLQGGFSGIGVEFNIYNDTINIIHVIKDGPSEKAGLQTGDKFLKVGDSTVAGTKITTEKIKFLLRGKGGSKTIVTVLREKEIKQVTVTRGMIPLNSLDAAYMITKEVGYVRLNKFSETTYHEFMDATLQLQKQGMQSLILDLRDNGGGILTEATNIADEFLDKDKLITYTEGKHFPKKEYRCQKDGIFEKGKLVILANEGTASASEIIIGALQDWDRATIIGRRTFGKGLVQEQYELSDGSGLRLTIARYYTPLGRSIQKSYSQGIKIYQQDLTNRFTDGELIYVDSIKHTNGKIFTTKAGKTVYSGGGITPDIFVPVDTTTGYNKNLRKIYEKGIINNFVYRNYVANKNKFAEYASPKDFEKNYIVDANTWNDFKILAQQDSINLNGITPVEKVALAHQIKTAAARQIWRTEGFYEVSNADDPMIKKALEILSK